MEIHGSMLYLGGRHENSRLEAWKFMALGCIRQESMEIHGSRLYGEAGMEIPGSSLCRKAKHGILGSVGL